MTFLTCYKPKEEMALVRLGDYHFTLLKGDSHILAYSLEAEQLYPIQREELEKLENRNVNFRKWITNP